MKRNVLISMTFLFAALSTTPATMADTGARQVEKVERIGAAYDAGRFKEARTLGIEACDTDPKFCIFPGMNYYKGEGGDRNHMIAASYFAKACEGGYPRGCTLLGIVIEKDVSFEGEVINADLPAARGAYAVACDGEEADGCFYLAMMHYKGEGGPTDESAALKYFRKACLYGKNDACGI